MLKNYRIAIPVLTVLVVIGLTALVLLPPFGVASEPTIAQAQQGEPEQVIAADSEPTAVMTTLRARLEELRDGGAPQEAFDMAMADAADDLTANPHRPNKFWEEIEACGFYPQETRLECIVKIKRNTGYTSFVGTHESVLFCVDWNRDGVFNSFGGASIESEGEGRFHVMNGSTDQPARPPWHYAVYRDIDPPAGFSLGDLRTSPGTSNINTFADRSTVRVKAILAWLVEPTNCDFVPIWGDVHNFKIRLDPIR